MWPSGASSSQRSISTKFCLIITGCGLCTGAKTAIYSCSVSVCGGCVDDLYGVVIIRFIWWMHTNHYSTKPTNLALGPHHYRCLLLLLAGHYICVCVWQHVSATATVQSVSTTPRWLPTSQVLTFTERWLVAECVRIVDTTRPASTVNNVVTASTGRSTFHSTHRTSAAVRTMIWYTATSTQETLVVTL